MQSLLYYIRYARVARRKNRDAPVNGSVARRKYRDTPVNGTFAQRKYRDAPVNGSVARRKSRHAPIGRGKMKIIPSLALSSPCFPLSSRGKTTHEEVHHLHIIHLADPHQRPVHALGE